MRPGRAARFADHPDRERVLGTLAEACQRTGWRIHAHVLMPNHYHLLVETPEGNLVAGMKAKGYEPYIEGRVLELGSKAGRKELDEQWKALRRGW